MKHTEQTIINYIETKVPQKQQKMFKEFFSYQLNLPSKRNTGRSYRTITIRIQNINLFLKTIDYKFTKINPINIHAFLDKYNRKTGLYASIKQFCNFAYQNTFLTEAIYKNATGIVINEHIKKSELKFRIPDHKWPELYNQLAGVKKFTLWFMLNTGVRVNELVHIETKDIHVDRKNDKYYLSIYPKPEYNFYPKTESSIRNIELREQEIRTIEKFLEVRAKYNLPHDFLIFNSTKKVRGVNIEDRGQNVENKTINRWLSDVIYYDEIEEPHFKCQMRLYNHHNGSQRKKACYEVFPDRKSHKHITPHLTRYSYASNIYFKGKSKGIDLLYQVSKQLGHSNPNITFEYLQLDKEEQHQAIKFALDIAYEN